MKRKIWLWVVALVMFRIHGLREGDLMHERCFFCAAWRQYAAWTSGMKVRGFWRMPYELPKEFF